MAKEAKVEEKKGPNVLEILLGAILVIILLLLFSSWHGGNTTAQPALGGGNGSTGGGQPVALYEHPGPTTGEAKASIGIDVQRLDTEFAAFVWRSVPMSIEAHCPTGYLCTLHLADGKIWVVQGDGGTSYEIVAGTFRFVSAYPDDDAVHRPCELFAKEQEFGRLEDPSFTVGTNLSCN